MADRLEHGAMGVVLAEYPVAPTNAYKQFATREYATANLRPRLVLSGTIVPEPVGGMLLVIGWALVCAGRRPR